LIKADEMELILNTDYSTKEFYEFFRNLKIKFRQKVFKEIVQDKEAQLKNYKID